MPRGGKRPGSGRPKGASTRFNEEVRRRAAATGELPLDYALRIMRNPKTDQKRRDAMCVAAMPFCHARFSSVEHSGKDGAPIPIRIESLTNAQIDQLIERIQGGGSSGAPG